MSDNIFSKAVVFTDLHFGRSGNSPVANQDNADFLLWAIDRARSWGAETCIFCGDYFDNRHSIGVLTMNAALGGLELIDKSFSKTLMLLGNHDLPYRENRSSSSVEIARNFNNIQIIKSPLISGDVALLPWLVDGEQKILKTVKSRYVFAHLEMSGFMLNSKVMMPEGDHVATAADFTGPEYVFSGHFHARQRKLVGQTNIVYLGNVMPFDFSDAWDADRGIMLLEWGHDPIFEAWSDQPLFRTTSLSKILDNPDAILCSRASVRAITDVTLHSEEAQEIRNALVADYGLRKFELIPQAEAGMEYIETEVVFKTVDQMVVEGIQSVDSRDIIPARLIEIYRSLA